MSAVGAFVILAALALAALVAWAFTVAPALTAIACAVVVCLVLASARSAARRVSPFGGYAKPEPPPPPVPVEHCEDGVPCDWCGQCVSDDQTVRAELQGMTMHNRCMQDYRMWSEALGQAVKP